MYLDTSTGFALLVLLLVFAAGWFWNDSLRARERMLQICSSLCRELRMQFLDETVSLAGLGLARDETGRVVIRRLYSFEFSDTGRDRWQGRAQLSGRRVVSVQFDHPEGVTILSGAAAVSPESARLSRSPLQGDGESQNRKH